MRWFRPAISAARVGEQIAVVWKRVFGAPAGGRIGRIAGRETSGSLASYSTCPM
jgi:hypothetical protein